MFKNCKEFYYEAIHNSGYKNELKYLEVKRHNNRDNNLRNNWTNNNKNMYNRINKNINKNGHRNIIWFNPTFCKLSNIKVGKYFLGLTNKHFKDDNSLRKIINTNNVKISYSCTNNISKIIDNHKKLINKLDWNNKENLKQSCNCKINKECFLGNKFNLNNITYQANVSTKENDTNEKTYIGMRSLNWKFRYYNQH